jgi:hypothetical protein
VAIADGDAGIDRPVWYAAINRKEIGPLTLAQLHERLGKGLVSLRTYVWRDGFASWTRLRDVPLLASLATAITETERHVSPRRARRVIWAVAGLCLVALVAALLVRRGTTPQPPDVHAPMASSGAP